MLHTWGQNLQHHPHAHYIVPAGGLTPDGSRWIASSNRFFLPVRAISRVFRGKFTAGLQQTTPQAPARQIATNAGADGSVVVGKIMDKDQYSYGFDAQTGEYGNLVTKGIIDPTKVVRSAIQGAASVAGLLITTEAMVAETPKKNQGAPAMPGGMGGMDF